MSSIQTGSPEQNFGGAWTEEKLDRVRKYIAAYMKIFSSNPQAAWYTTTYLDAFAGSGYRTDPGSSTVINLPLFDEDDSAEIQAFQKGSARIALEVSPPFDKYVFVDKSEEFSAELEKLKSQYPQLSNRIDVKQAEANEFIASWVERTDWKKNRAVVFLDPHGMQVRWKTIEALARTEAVDLWVLMPLGQAVTRLLTKGGEPPEAWARTLTDFFGTDSWRQRFYTTKEQMTLFGSKQETSRLVGTDSIGQFFVERLASVFASVAENPLPLYNSKNCPIYLLCFASANPKGAPTAVRIAKNILGG